MDRHFAAGAVAWVVRWFVQGEHVDIAEGVVRLVHLVHAFMQKDLVDSSECGVRGVVRVALNAELNAVVAVGDERLAELLVVEKFARGGAVNELAKFWCRGATAAGVVGLMVVASLLNGLVGVFFFAL